MSVPLRQSVRTATYLARQRLARREKFPLLVELEPLYQCNLACAGCGKIQHPDHVLRRRMPVDQALAAIEESGAPMVSIAGGEPLIHPEIDQIANELRTQYALGYTPTNNLKDGTFRKIEIKTKEGHRVQARRGYYAIASR